MAENYSTMDFGYSQNPDDALADWEALQRLKLLSSHQTPDEGALGVSRTPPPVPAPPLVSAHGGDPQTSLDGEQDWSPAAMRERLKDYKDIDLSRPQGNVGVYPVKDSGPGLVPPVVNRVVPPALASLSKMVEGASPDVGYQSPEYRESGIQSPEYRPNVLGGGNPAAAGALAATSEQRANPLDEELMRQYAEDKRRKEHYDKYGPAILMGADVTSSVRGVPQTATVEGYKDWAKPRGMELLKTRASAQEEMSKGKAAGLEHNADGPYANAIRIQFMSSPQYDQLAARLSQETGDSIEQTKADLFKNHVSKMTPYGVKELTKSLGTSGSFSAEQAVTAMTQAQERSEQSRNEKYGYENRDAKSSLEAKWGKNNATAALARQAIRESYPELAQAPGFDNMSAGEIGQQWPFTQTAMEIAGRIAVNNRDVLRGSKISDTESFNVTGAGGQGVNKLSRVAMGSEADRERYNNDKLNHGAAWEVGQDVLNGVAEMGGLEATVKSKVNSTQGALYKQQVNRFADAYEKSTGNKQVADRLRSQNVLDTIWGASGKGGLLLDALNDLQIRTQIHRKNTTDSSLGEDGEGPAAPPMGLPFKTSFESGRVIYHFYDPKTRRVFEYSRKGPSVWEHRQLRPKR